jgi:hypothetical protein
LLVPTATCIPPRQPAGGHTFGCLCSGTRVPLMIGPGLHALLDTSSRMALRPGLCSSRKRSMILTAESPTTPTVHPHDHDKAHRDRPIVAICQRHTGSNNEEYIAQNSLSVSTCAQACSSLQSSPNFPPWQLNHDLLTKSCG